MDDLNHFVTMIRSIVCVLQLFSFPTCNFDMQQLFLFVFPFLPPAPLSQHAQTPQLQYASLPPTLPV